ncbi:MAG: MerR family transcriptional regulator [Defluviitaleaceae bacterium]|nr:MerR family transcriptional regulator [Defluviitaleaceae bacterium]
MEYSINKLAKMSGVSTRTLRYYDEINLLKPSRIASSGYRIYDSGEVDKLQQILFYRELDFPLENIRKILSAPDFDINQAFISHLTALERKRQRLDEVIANVAKSIKAMKGEILMSDKEKFEAFKEKLINENEEKYGDEIRKKYGDKAVSDSNAKLAGLSFECYEAAEQLLLEFENILEAAFKERNPAGELAQKACELHKKWLSIFYHDYNAEYHRNLGEMYVADNRFRANYDKIAPGCSEFLRDAINIYTK